jgi:hypothetical protein
MRESTVPPPVMRARNANLALASWLRRFAHGKESFDASQLILAATSLEILADVSGEIIPVPREELWRVGVAVSENRYDAREFQLALQQINSWLTPDTSNESAK